jgi:membrane fusion protein (multidrug efflux system)
MTEQTEIDLVNSPAAANGRSNGKHSSSEERSAEELESRINSGRSRPARLAVPLGLALIGVGVLGWWLHARSFETTDDAQIEGHLNSISSRISGTVTYINPNVENNHWVERGTLLLELDPRDYEADLEHARANLETRRAQARSARFNVPIIDARAFSQLHIAEAAKAEAMAAVDAEQANLVGAQEKLDQDEAIYARAERDRLRYRALVEKHEISRSEYDARETEAFATAHLVEVDRAAANSEKQKVDQARNMVLVRQAQIDSARTAPHQVSDARAQSESAIAQLDQAKADMHTAELNLSYTKIYSPVAGVIGRKTVELGHRIQPGQGLLVIVPLNDIWVTANFKETQMKRMTVGQPVRIHVDAFGRDYKGTIENLPGAAGPLFSLFPPENASGNYVKVVQRFPVRIQFDKNQDPEHLLRPGMSVEPAVKVR